MFKIVMIFNGRELDMPGDINLGLIEACWRANIYKKRNPKNGFMVVNVENGDIEYET